MEARVTVCCDCDGCLTDGHVYVDSEGRESLRFTKKDGWLLREAAAAGITVVVVTQDPNPAPSRARALKMGCEHVACFDAHGKAALVRERKAAGERVVYIGDSPQDLEAMEVANVALCPSDAVEWCGSDLRKFISGLVMLQTDGGHGVLYEALQRLMAGDFG